MTSLISSRSSLDSLPAVLPRLIASLSLSRSQITLEQVRATLESGDLDRIVYIISHNTGTASPEPVAAAIAILGNRAPIDRVSGEPILDTATMIHAGLIADFHTVRAEAVLQSLSRAFDAELARSGVRFVQWATDETSGVESTEKLGFKRLGVLDYLCGEIDAEASSPSHLRFTAVDLENKSERQRFADLIEQTYLQTLDCPELSKYRTVNQTLAGYRAASAFAPQFWLTVFDDDNNSVGGVILGIHESPSGVGGSNTIKEPPAGNEAVDPTSNPLDKSNLDDHSSGQSPLPSSRAIEIVYMGIVPKARGRGLGKHLVQQAMVVARQIGASQMILAVDRRNQPARLIYENAGLRAILSESVWIKVIDPAIQMGC